MRKLIYESKKKNALWDMLEECGNYDVKRLALSVIEARKEIAEKLYISLASKISFERRLIKVDGVNRIVVQDFYINPHVIRLIQDSALNFNHFDEIYHQFFTKVSRCYEGIAVLVPDSEIRALLDIGAEEEVLQISGKAYDQMENIVEYYEYYIRTEDIEINRRFD